MSGQRDNRFVGSVVALALGDALGAPHEGGPLERTLWAFIGKRAGKHRWTDDTQMTLDVMASLQANAGNINQDDLAQRFAGSYRWSRGYGAGTSRILRGIRSGMSWQNARWQAYRNGSYGNGGAMRAPVVGLFFADAGDTAISKAAAEVASVTHAHPLAQEGAALIALATALTFNDVNTELLLARLEQRAESTEFKARLCKASDWIRGSTKPDARSVAIGLGNSVAAAESCVTAIYTAMAFLENPYEDMLRFVVKIGGDVDTIAAMASAIWGAKQGLGALPAAQLHLLEGSADIIAPQGNWRSKQHTLNKALHRESLLLPPSLTPSA